MHCACGASHLHGKPGSPAKMAYKIGILSTHPIQYHSPWYRELASRLEIDLTVYYCHRPTAQDQAAAGFGVAFEWDIPLLDGYQYEFLTSRSVGRDLWSVIGCDTPEIVDTIRRE